MKPKIKPLPPPPAPPAPADKPKKVRYRLLFRLLEERDHLSTIDIVAPFKSIKKASKRGQAIANASKGLLQFEGCSA